DDGRCGGVHRGMAGRRSMVSPGAARERHDHVEIRFDDGTRLVYHAPRRFGLLLLVGAREVAEITGRGVDALAREFTAALVFAFTRRKRASIKATLMDQRLVAGLGNIYVNELLFRAGIR